MLDLTWAADDVELIAGLRDLTWLSAHQRKRLTAALIVEQVERDGLIFSEGRGAGRDLFILLRGAVRLTCVNITWKRTVVALIPPGIIPRPPLLTGFNAHCRCEALCNSRVARISLEKFFEIAFDNEVSNFDRVARLVYSRMDNLLTRYPGFAGFDLRARLALALLELASAFGARDSRGVVLTINPTQQDLADLVGASRPKVSIVLSEFASVNAIERQGRRIALVTSRLEAIVRARYGSDKANKTR